MNSISRYLPRLASFPASRFSLGELSSTSGWPEARPRASLLANTYQSRDVRPKKRNVFAELCFYRWTGNTGDEQKRRSKFGGVLGFGTWAVGSAMFVDDQDNLKNPVLAELEDATMEFDNHRSKKAEMECARQELSIINPRLALSWPGLPIIPGGLRGGGRSKVVKEGHGRPEFSKCGRKTYMVAQEGQIGYTWDPDPDRNFVGLSSFALFPQYRVTFGSRPALCCIVDYAHSDKSLKATIPENEVTKLETVMKHLQQQHPGEIIRAYYLKQEDYFYVMATQLKSFWKKYDESKTRSAVRNIGPQVHLWPPTAVKLKRHHLEFFFNSEQGVTGLDGNPKEDAKTAYHEEALRGVPQVRYEPSGRPGLIEFLEPPIATTTSRMAYWEGITASVLPARHSFDGCFNRKLIGKQANMTLTGGPGMGKSKELKTALKIGSHKSQFFSNQSSEQGLCAIGEHYALLQVLDDNESVNKDNKMTVGEFENATKITKGDGAKQQLRTLATTSNVAASIEEKYNSRKIVIEKKFRSYEEPTNMLKALNDQVALVNFLATDKQPLDEMVRGCANYVNLVPIPPRFLEVEEDEEFNCAALSPDGKHVSQYVLWLAETIEEIKKVAPGARFRDWECHGTFFMGVRWLDQITADLPDSYWNKLGGSAAYFREYLPFFFQTKQFAKEKGSRSPRQLLGQLIRDLEHYASSGEKLIDEKIQQDIRLIASENQLCLWLRATTTLSDFSSICFNDIAPFFQEQGFVNKPSMVQGKTEKGYYVPLRDLAAPEISIILEYVFPLICLFFLMQDGWLMECLTWPFQLPCRKNQQKYVAALRSQLGLVNTKEEDVETENVVTAGSSEMRRGATPEKSSHRQRSCSEGPNLYLSSTADHSSNSGDRSRNPKRGGDTSSTSSTTSTRSTHEVVNFASLSPGTLREVEAATKAVDMCFPSVLREQDQQAAEKERQRKASELTEQKKRGQVGRIGSHGNKDDLGAKQKIKKNALQSRPNSNKVVEKTSAVGAATSGPAVSSQTTPEETGPQSRVQRGEKPPPAKKRGTLPGY